MDPCPKCGEDEIHTDSSFSLQISVAWCSSCDFRIQRNVPEEELIIIWNNLERGKK
jgi:predicted RNA-binding Zn-ribbon protein involved in translation (DUF1610 family)